MRTQVAIIGAGPAGLLLSRLLSLRGVDSIVVENRSRAHVEARIRAGVLEQGTADLLVEAGVGTRLRADGLRHDGVHLQWPGERRRIDFRALTGRSVWIHGQTEVVKELLAAREEEVHFSVSDTAVHDVTGPTPSVSFVDSSGTPRRITCSIVVGADGFHGVSRESIPAPLRTTWERDYPYAWLGILADVPPSTDELIYAWHPDGFALHSMRSTTRSRLYLQVDPGERIEDWPDDRVWSALATRLGLPGWELRAGPVLDKGITPMRSFVSTPMRHGALFLVGDAAHIVPPTGAKGLNLAVADVAVLAPALAEFFASGRTDLLDGYEERALRRVWRSTHFAWWMTAMLHTSPDPLDRPLQLSQLEYVCSSAAAATSLAENYVGLPH
ncbi:4-hydroxybenzoate 3-monooxygenase [Actinosynnema sp. NPDC020468]|uniref:4-hydroxybenzoate 3-monooxygenase n=1 Tax=Actinosynnema sp. NPDC020468 TaxID=3154488 RepID=UPI0033FFD77A